MAAQLDYPIPQRPSTTQLLTAFNSASVRWPGALRAGLAILLPGAIALLTGHDYAILLISTGAFTVIFGEGHPYRTRPRVMLTAGTALITVAAVGVLVGHLIFAPGHGHWWLLLAGLYTTALAAVCGFAQNALRLPPPGDSSSRGSTATCGRPSRPGRASERPSSIDPSTPEGASVPASVPHGPRAEQASSAVASPSVLRADRVHDGERLGGPGWIALAEGRVVAVGGGDPPRTHGPVHDLGDALLAPGCVDVHCHGGGGHAVESGAAAARAAAAAHARAGTTTVVASLVTDHVDALAAQLTALTPLCAEGVLAGVHLEGPWLSPRHRGALCCALSLFAGSRAGGERAAAIYTVIQTCKANGVDPQAYIADVIARVAGDWPATRWDELMPWNWVPQTDQPTAQAA